MLSIFENIFSRYRVDFFSCCDDRDGKIMPKGTYYLGRSKEKTMKRKKLELACLLGTVIIFLTSGINVMGSQETETVTIDCGYIHLEGPPDDPNCYINTIDNYNIDVGEGGNVRIEVDYYMDCSGAADDGYVDISDVIFNKRPKTPNTPDGPTSGKIGESYTFFSSTIDLKNDQVFYLFDWDDGTDSGWLGPFDSGDECSASHIWNEKGIYSIRVKAKDVNDIESEWSNPSLISMSKNKLLYRFPFIYKFLEQHPYLFPLLRQILKI